MTDHHDHREMVEILVSLGVDEIADSLRHLGVHTLVTAADS